MNVRDIRRLGGGANDVQDKTQHPVWAAVYAAALVRELGRIAEHGSIERAVALPPDVVGVASDWDDANRQAIWLADAALGELPEQIEKARDP